MFSSDGVVFLFSLEVLTSPCGVVSSGTVTTGVVSGTVGVVTGTKGVVSGTTGVEGITGTTFPPFIISVLVMLPFSSYVTL